MIELLQSENKFSSYCLIYIFNTTNSYNMTTKFKFFPTSPEYDKEEKITNNNK